MRKIAMALRMMLAAALPTVLAPAAWAGDAGVDTAISQFSAALHAGDNKTAKTFLTGHTVILDDAAPYYWAGANAFEDWQADLAKASVARGMTEEDAALGAPSRVEVSGDHAYAVLPASHSFKIKGRLMREKAQLTFVLVKNASAWKIESWTWTGPRATPVH
jgi:ketosteroid isomerase-like protein